MHVHDAQNQGILRGIRQVKTKTKRSRPGIAQAFLRTVSYLGYAFGVVSLVRLVDAGNNIGWVAPLKAVLVTYVESKNFLVGWAEPSLTSLIMYMGSWLSLNVTLYDQWSDVFLLMILYFGARARSYWNSQRRNRAIFRVAIGIPIALFSSAFSGLILANNWTSNLLMTALPIMGMLVFDVVDSAMSASFVRDRESSWWKTFYRYLNFSVPVLFIGIIIAFVLTYTFRSSLIARSSDLGLLCMIAFILLLSIYWAVRAWMYAHPPNHRLPGETVAARFSRASAASIARQLAIVISGALAWILMNAGLALSGMPTSSI